MPNKSLDARRKQRLSCLACLFDLTLLGGSFRPRHLNRWAASDLKADRIGILQNRCQSLSMDLGRNSPFSYIALNHIFALSRRIAETKKVNGGETRPNHLPEN
jgi:hypothetical protein